MNTIEEFFVTSEERLASGATVGLAETDRIILSQDSG